LTRRAVAMGATRQAARKTKARSTPTSASNDSRNTDGRCSGVLSGVDRTSGRNGCDVLFPTGGHARTAGKQLGDEGMRHCSIRSNHNQHFDLAATTGAGRPVQS
jgi:hypothetical protein